MDVREYLGTENEKPLDRIVPDGGLTSVLRKIGIIGDSLSSGEFEGRRDDGTPTYTDMFDYSWGQFLARSAGITVYNMSCGGMTAKRYIGSFAAERGFWALSRECNAFVIALGLNDIVNDGFEPGDISDVDLAHPKKNKPTFIGYYAQIVSRLRLIKPDAPLFFVTMPKNENGSVSSAHTALLYEIAALAGHAYVIDLDRYAPVYDAGFRKKFYLYGHMNAAGYYFTSKLIGSSSDFLNRHNIGDVELQHLV